MATEEGTSFRLPDAFFDGEERVFAGLFRMDFPGAGVSEVFRDPRLDGITTGSVWVTDGISLMGLAGCFVDGVSSTQRWDRDRDRDLDLGALGDEAGKSSSSLDDDGCLVVGTELKRNGLGTIVTDHNQK